MPRDRNRIICSGLTAFFAVSLAGCLNISPSNPAERPSWADEALANTADVEPPADVPLIRLPGSERRDMQAQSEEISRQGEAVRASAQSIIDAHENDQNADDYLNENRERANPPAEPN